MPEQAIEGFPLSPQQEHLWSRTAGRGPLGAQALVRLEGLLDTERLEEAFAQLVDRHEILRTTFHLLAGMKVPLQVVEDGAPALQRRDLSHLSSQEQESEVATLWAQAGAGPWPWAEGPLLQAHLWTLDGNRHILVLALPVLCCDAAGLESLVAELSQLYAASGTAGDARAGEDADDEPMQYVDIAEWQRELLESEEGEEGRTYWRDHHLPTPPAELPLVGPADGEVEPATVHATLPADATAPLRALAERLNVGPAQIFLAAWQALLWRLAGEPEALELGCAFDGRKFEELADLPGLFTQHLPLRTTLRRDVPFVEFVKEVGGASEEYDAWQEYFSWRLLTEEGEDPALPAWGFSFEDEAAEHRAGAVRFTLERREVAGERFDLELIGSDGGAEFSTRLRYDRRRVTEAEAERLLERFHCLLHGAVGRPKTALSTLAVVGTEERRWLVEGLNQTDVDHPGPRTLHQLVGEQAEGTPHRVAVEAEDGTLTFAHLAQRTEAFATALRSAGVAPGTRVGVCLEPSLDLVVTLLAILRAGGAYVPLDPAYPEERLATMLEDARPALLVTHRGLLPTEVGQGVELFDLDQRSVSSMVMSSMVMSSMVMSSMGMDQSLGEGSGPDDLAYVIFTSGSTGRPKGVMIPHRAIANRLLWMQRADPLDEGDRVLQKTAFSFDASVWELFLPLLAGARLVLAAPGGAQDSSYLVRTVASRRMTVLQLVPSMLRVFLDEDGAGACASLRRVFCGGEALPADLAHVLRQRLSASLTNLYGPTECSIDVASHPCGGGEADGILPLGTPLDNTRIHLLDRHFRLVPLGQPGELCAAGAGLAWGYLDRPALTAECFVPDPFSAIPGERLYRTGDLARRRGDGVLEFLGRIDHQVKLRGFRIELGEVEAWLRRQDAVAEAVVVVRTDGDSPESAQLVAYVVPRSEEDTRTDELADTLRRHLEENLPHYMVPSIFVPLDSLPRAPNGKLDRRALPAPETVLAGDGFVAPRTPTEQLLAAAWGEVLGVDRLGRDDNVFQLGWHSLMATQLVSRLRRLFGVELSLRSAFEAPTVGQLAARIEEALRADPGLQAPPIVRTERTQSPPLSFAQYRLWFLDTLEPGSAFYNVPVALEFKGTLDIAVLRGVLTEVRRRHESLRTTFTLEGEEPVQVIAPPSPLPAPLVDLSALPESVRDGEAQRLMKAEAGTPFDLAQGPLLRLFLVRLDITSHLGLLTMHHIVSDGWSTAILTREIAALYAAAHAGRPSPLPELELQYADFAAWQRQWLRGDVLEGQLAYWRDQLAGAPPLLKLPTDRPRPEEQSFHGSTRGLVMPQELADGLHALGRQEGATLFMMLLAAGQVLLGWYGEQDDVVLGTDVANRNRAETEGVIGFFINQLALRTRLDGNPTFREVLARVRRTTSGAYAHQDLPFDKLVEALNPERALGHAPIFQAKLNLINVPAPDFELPGLEISPLATSRTTAQFDWILNLIENEHGLASWVEYSTDLFDGDTIDRMLGSFQALLQAVVKNPDLTREELGEVLEEAESNQRIAQQEARKGSLRGKLRRTRRTRTAVRGGT